MNKSGPQLLPWGTSIRKTRAKTIFLFLRTELRLLYLIIVRNEYFLKTAMKD